MASVKLQAGAEIDLASGAELREQTQALAARLDALNLEPLLRRVNADLNVDASGNVGGGAAGVGQVVFVCPQNMTARLIRTTFAAPGSTPAAPLAAGWLQGYVDSPGSPANLAVQTPAVGSTTVLPSILTDGTSSALMLRDQQTLTFVGAGLTANLVIGLGMQWWIYATPGYPAPSPNGLRVGTLGAGGEVTTS